MEKIAIASDHAGYDLKQVVIGLLRTENFKVVDLGPENSDSVDYPDYGLSLAKEVVEKRVGRAIVICGTGVGLSSTGSRGFVEPCVPILIPPNYAGNTTIRIS